MLQSSPMFAYIPAKDVSRALRYQMPTPSSSCVHHRRPLPCILPSSAKGAKPYRKVLTWMRAS